MALPSSTLPSTQESGLGELENRAVCELVSTKKAKPQCKYTDEDRFLIAKYASQHGPCQAANHFKGKYPTLRESTVRAFSKKYKNQVDTAKKLNRPVEKKIVNLTQGRPLMLGVGIDEKVRNFLIALRRKGGFVGTSVATMTAQVLLARSDDPSLKNIRVTATWGRSMLRRMGFVQRVATTGKAEIPEGAKQEAGLQYHYKIVNVVERYNIPPSMIMNSDQTPSKYVTVGRTTMAPRNSKRVGPSGSNDKRSITLTLTVTLDGRILPFQIIYGGKTKQSLPKIIFPEGFSLSVNKNHYSNTEEVVKHLEEIVIPHVLEERRKLDDPDQYALLIWDAFRGQKTEPVTALLEQYKILCEYVPNNMTDWFQVLDLTVNKWLKGLMKEKFNAWFATILRNELDSGKSLEEIDIKFLLTTMKPLHATWLIECYDKLSSEEGRKVILSGWRAAGISGALESGLQGFPSLDPFNDMDPFEQPIDIVATSIVSPYSEEYIDEQKVVSEDEDEYVLGNVNNVIDDPSEDLSSGTESDDA